MPASHQHDTEPDFAIVGDLSDEAIDALAALLIELVEMEGDEE